MEKLQQYYDMVNQVFQTLGQRHADARIETNQWVYIKGSAFSLVEVREVELGGANQGIIQMISPVCKVPRKKVEFFTELLSYNHKFAGPSFSIFEDTVVLKMARPLKGLDPADIEYMIKSVGSISDKLDNALINVYDAKKVDVSLDMLRTIAKVQYFNA